MRGNQLAVLILLLFGLVSVDAGSAPAAVLTVTDCGDTTPGGAPGQLRRLITNAAPGDTILVPACIIRLTGAANEDFNAGGDLDISKTITIQGAGARRTVIDGGGVDRVFDVTGPSGFPFPLTVTISDLMIRNGMGSTRGGGIRNSGSLSLNRVVVRANGITGAFEAGGGGIANQGTVDAVEITVEDNFVSGPIIQSGGGIYNTGVFTLTRSSVYENAVLAAEAFASNTGGIVNSGTLTIADSTISGNDGGADGPGGILNTGTVSVVGSSIADNRSQLGVADGILSSGSASLTNTIVALNFNTASATPSKQCDGIITSVGGNLATDSTCGLGGPNDAVVADAGLLGLGNHGGLGRTHPLASGSPAIDTAFQALCSPTDQRGVDRPQDGNGDGLVLCDKGAFETTPLVFADVPVDYFARGAIEALRANGITAGCGVGPLIFCPDGILSREQFAVFLLRTLHGAAFVPPAAVGLFADVPIGSPFAPWVEALFNQGITAGCGVAPLRFCPSDPVTRGQLSVLLLRTLSIPGFVPPAAVGLFADMAVGHPFTAWAEEFFRRGITTGCQTTPLAFCPDTPATRAQIALFLVRAVGFGF
jgi:hypothetical protein